MKRKLNIHRATEKIVGAVRLSAAAFDKLDALAKKSGVSKQEVLRKILDDVIGEYEV